MHALLSIVPLAAVDSVNVLALLAVSYIWISSRSRATYLRTAAAYIVGGIGGLTLTFAFSFTVILALVHRILDTLPRTAAATTVLVIALVVLAAAVRGFVKPPTSLPVHRAVGPPTAAALGLLTWATQSLTSAPFYAAIAVMAKDATPARLGLSAVFIVIALIPVTTLLVALALCPPDMGARLVARMQTALPTASRVVSVLLAIGATAAAALAFAEIL